MRRLFLAKPRFERSAQLNVYHKIDQIFTDNPFYSSEYNAICNLKDNKIPNGQILVDQMRFRTVSVL